MRPKCSHWLSACTGQVWLLLPRPISTSRQAVGTDHGSPGNADLPYLDPSPTQGRRAEGLRVAHGRGLLQHTNMSVAEVALASGFEQTLPFSKAFRRRFCVRPSQVTHFSPRSKTNDPKHGA